MSRALIIGPRDELARAVESLYRLKILHIVDHEEGEDELPIGPPLGAASQASETLVKLRSIANVLQVKEEATREEGAEPVESDMRDKILALELNLSEEDASKKKIQALLAELNRKIDEVTPFAQLPLALDDYRGYDNLEVFVGKVPREIPDLASITPEFESFEAPGFLAVFVPKDRSGSMRDFLAQRGFTSVPVPEGSEEPRAMLANLQSERERWEKRLAEIDERLATLRERHAGFLAAAREQLEIEVEKAEAPLRFAVTDHTFIADGWVPSTDFAAMKTDLERLSSVFVEQVDQKTDAGESHEEGHHDPPVRLKNPKPIRPFETLVNLFGTPN